MLAEYSIPHEYQIDSAFNKNLIFAYQPPPEINIAKLPHLNKHWLNDLETIIYQTDPSIEKKIFDRHIGEISNYRSKIHLKKQLQLIYHRLKGNLDSDLGELSLDERKALINKLTEEISYCTEGFHNRVNLLVDLFQKPRNLSELLCVVRKELIEEVASVLTDEIHSWNRVSVVAANDGLGVKANFPEDHYIGNLNDTSIRRTLQKIFKQKFTPYTLPSLLIDAFNKFIPELEIEKNNPLGLNLEMKEKIILLIRRFIPEYINEIPNHPNHELNYFEIFKDKENPHNISLININWEKLYQSFFKALGHHKYFENPQLNTLLDNAYCNLFITKKNNDVCSLIISKLFKEEKIPDLLDQLEDLSNRFPNYYQKTSKVKVFTKNLLEFNDYLTRRLKITKQYSSQVLLGFHLLINLDLRRKNFLVEKLSDSLLLKNHAGSNLLMFAAQHNSVLVRDILIFLKANQKIIDKKIIKRIFLMKNKDNLNALMIAAMHHPQSLEAMLEFIGEHIQTFTDNLQSIFLEKHNEYNLLMLAASKEAVDILVRFFNKYICSFTKKIFFSLFTQQEKNSNSAWTVTLRNHPDYIDDILKSCISYLRTEGEALNSNGACTSLLMLAAKNQAEATFSILEFISKNIKKFDPSILEKMFLEKNQDGYTILMLATQYQPKALEIILDFINTHSNLFSKEVLSEIFLLTNPENYTCLMLAVEFQLDSIMPILNFINSKMEYIKPCLLEILTKKNKKGCSALMLARRDPYMLAALLYFIFINIDNISPMTLERFLLEKHKSGFTLLMYAARDKPESLDFILEFIKENPSQFSDKTIYRLILEENNLEYNSLMLAARNQSTAVNSILKFIQDHPQSFPDTDIPYVFLGSNTEGMNTLMVAAQYQPEAVKLILDFVQSKPDIFPRYTLNQLLLAHDTYGVNALMLAATYQAKVVELLLSFVSKNIQHFGHTMLKEFIFKDIHDKQAASAVFFGGGYNFRKTVLSVTSQLEDRTAINALLKFIDQHIELLGIDLFTKLLTEQDKGKNYIFNPACSRYPFTMKKILNFIATPPHCEELKLFHPLVADFIFEQLVHWSIKTFDDEELFDKIISNCSTLLIKHFDVDRFGEYCDNLKKVTERLFSRLTGELYSKKANEQNQMFFFRWFSYTEQELQAAKYLKIILDCPSYEKLPLLENLEENLPKYFKSKSPLSCLFVAFKKIETLKFEKVCEAYQENDDVLEHRRFQA